MWKSVKKKIEILLVPWQCMFSLMTFTVSNEEYFQTNSSVRNINTRNKHYCHRPNANLSCFQKVHSVLASEFSSLSHSVTVLQNEKTKFKVALKIYLNTQSFYPVDEFFYVQR